MKLKIGFFSFFSLLLLLAACDDDINTVGLGTKPNSDNLSIHSDTIYLSGALATQDYTKTVQFDSIYFGSNSNQLFLLGNFYDPLFGSLKGDFLTQFYYSTFSTDSIINNAADSVKLGIYYISWLGDSLAPMVAKVYPVKKSVKFTEEYHYTNIDLYNKYVSPAQPWATQPYTAKNSNVPDMTYVRGNNVITRGVVFDLMSTGIDTSLIREWKRNPDTFSSTINFRNYFPGIYITTSSGEGNILSVRDLDLKLYYSTFHGHGKAHDGGDSIRKDSTVFNIATDLINSVQYKNTTENLTVPNLDYTFVKAPAGVYTQYTLPLAEIAAKIGSRQINSIRLSITASPKDDWRYALGASEKMLLIRKDTVANFFKSVHTAVAPIAYTATYSNSKYDFYDISAMVKKGLAEGKTELDVMLIPVFETITYVPYNGQQVARPLSTTYDIRPSAVKLRKGSDAQGNHFLKLEILSSEIAN